MVLDDDADVSAVLTSWLWSLILGPFSIMLTRVNNNQLNEYFCFKNSLLTTFAVQIKCIAS